MQSGAGSRTPRAAPNLNEKVLVMASRFPITVPPVQQPDLRSFIVCDRLPEACLSYLVADHQNDPHLRPGDVVIIDPEDREPCMGELFLIARADGSRDIVETWSQQLRAGSGPNGKMIDTTCWFVAGSARARTNAEVEDRIEHGAFVGWADGPYATEGPRAGSLQKRLIGKVVGILEPSFAEPLRMARIA